MLRENACFSEGETEALTRANIPEVTWPKPRYIVRYLPGPEGLRAREEDCSLAPQGPRPSHLRYCSEQSPSGSHYHRPPRAAAACGRGPDSECICSSSRRKLWTGLQPWKSHFPARPGHPHTSHPPHQDLNKGPESCRRWVSSSRLHVPLPLRALGSCRCKPVHTEHSAHQRSINSNCSCLLIPLHVSFLYGRGSNINS